MLARKASSASHLWVSARSRAQVFACGNHITARGNCPQKTALDTKPKSCAGKCGGDSFNLLHGFCRGLPAPELPQFRSARQIALPGSIQIAFQIHLSPELAQCTPAHASSPAGATRPRPPLALSAPPSTAWPPALARRQSRYLSASHWLSTCKNHTLYVYGASPDIRHS